MEELKVTKTEDEMGAWTVVVTDGEREEKDDGTLALGHRALNSSEAGRVEQYLRSFFDEDES